MAKKIKKVDVKLQAKLKVMEVIKEKLAESGFEVLDNAESFGFTKGTLVIRDEICDIQIKPITPKQGVTRYEVEEE